MKPSTEKRPLRTLGIAATAFLATLAVAHGGGANIAKGIANQVAIGNEPEQVEPAMPSYSEEQLEQMPQIPVTAEKDQGVDDLASKVNPIAFSASQDLRDNLRQEVLENAGGMVNEGETIDVPMVPVPPALREANQQRLANQ